MSSLTAKIHIASDIVLRYDELARRTGQSRDMLVADVLSAYLEQESRDRQQTLAGIAEAGSGNFATDEEMEVLFAHYGGPHRDSLRREAAAVLRESCLLPTGI